MRIARDGVPLIGGLLLSTAAGWGVHPMIAVGLLPFAAAAIWFFRDPERTPPADPDIWVSPADGTVVEVVRVAHPFTGEATRVGIFMSPLDVHVNRAVCDGKVAFLEYVPGRKWMAFSPKASEDNERFSVGLETAAGPAMMTQIAGFLARRIVCRVKRGDGLRRGERYGMIKLGSRVDVLLPDSVRCVVSVGDRVRAGESRIGVVEHEREAHEA